MLSISKVLSLVLLAQSQPLAHSSKDTDRPNIVILFADNLGYNDIGIFGSPAARTPNIDRLAREGMKMNNWNSAGHVCSQSRAAMMTGKYPVKTGVYPDVFFPDAANGLLPEETTLAEFLKEKEYATSIVGKWHLGHREEFLPTNQGFDEWYGIPYHASGGSVDDHICGFDTNLTKWLPLYEGTQIVEQPVDLTTLAQRYAKAAQDFIHKSVQDENPFFLFVPFTHVHSLCAPHRASCMWASPMFSKNSPNATFVEGVEEMDWIAGEVLDTLKSVGVEDNTVVFFTSDNGPWVAEQSCSGAKGPFEGRWLRDNVDMSCTACPVDYKHSPTPERPRRCVHKGLKNTYYLDGVHCGEDTGLGSVWEANLRMPAVVKWPGHIPAETESMDMVSTLDVVPTVLSMVGIDIPEDIDGKDITDELTQTNVCTEDRALFFWRDGFKDGPFPPPLGRFDVAAAKLGNIKAWIWTKSANNNGDEEVFHDPPLLFDVHNDPAEAYPLNPDEHKETIEKILHLVKQHKEETNWAEPLTMDRSPEHVPCIDKNNYCRSKSNAEKEFLERGWV